MSDEERATDVRRRAWLAGWDDAINELQELTGWLGPIERRKLDRRRNELADEA